MNRKPETLAKQLGLEFNQPELFVRALTHRSMGAKNNERLEYLGDSILGFVIAEKLYEMFPEAGEGILSRLRASLVNQTSLAELARSKNIGDFLKLGSGELKSGGFRRDSILSDALEAIFGAIVKDQGVERCRAFILDLFENKLSRLSADNWHKDPKTQLQELMQARQKTLPVYQLLGQSGVAHDQIFKIQCTVEISDEPTLGTGVSRKKAEQMAAEKMLKKLEKKIS